MLDVSRRSARIPVAVSGSTALIFAVTGIRNPAEQAVGIRVDIEIEASGRTKVIHLGTAAPFPADQPAVFRFPVPRDDRSDLAASTSAVVLLELVPLASPNDLRGPVSIDVQVRELTDSSP